MTGPPPILTEQRCENCRFRDWDNLCRRRSPMMRSPNEFNLIAMLQAIAIAQLRIAGLIEGDEIIDEDVWKETTEHYQPDSWPHVEDWDWCGEWKETVQRTIGDKEAG